MLGNHIDDTLTELDHNTLYTMAEWHDKQSTILRARAHALAERQHGRDQVSERVKFIQNSPRTVMKYLRAGHDINNALKRAADHTGLPEKTIANNWFKYIDSKRKEHVRERNKLAFEMHGLGIPNVAIADRLNLHPVTVSRILKKEREKRLVKNPNPHKIAFFRDGMHKDARSGANKNRVCA